LVCQAEDRCNDGSRGDGSRTCSSHSPCFDTQDADIFRDAAHGGSNNNASVLAEPAPYGNYVVETRVHLNVPPEDCCFNYRQAGLLIYGDDDNFI
jgi:arabinan endo-1,5-alpha-L-arabinosidase